MIQEVERCMLDGEIVSNSRKGVLIFPINNVVNGFDEIINVALIKMDDLANNTIYINDIRDTEVEGRLTSGMKIHAVVDTNLEPSLFRDELSDPQAARPASINVINRAKSFFIEDSDDIPIRYLTTLKDLYGRSVLATAEEFDLNLTEDSSYEFTSDIYKAESFFPFMYLAALVKLNLLSESDGGGAEADFTKLNLEVTISYADMFPTKSVSHLTGVSGNWELLNDNTSMGFDPSSGGGAGSGFGTP
jgi:hypothetical protein